MNRRTLVLLGTLLLPATSGANEGLAHCSKLESVDEPRVRAGRLEVVPGLGAGTRLAADPGKRHW